MELTYIGKKAGKVLLIHLLAWLCYSLLMLGVNRLTHKGLQLWDVLATNLLIIPLFYGLVGIIWLMVHDRRRLLGWLLLVMAIPLVMVVAYLHVYYLLPALGVVLFRPDVPFTLAEFSKVIFLHYVHIAAYAGLYVWYMRRKRSGRAKRRGGFIVKPVTPGRLLRAIYHALGWKADVLDPQDYIVLHDVEGQVNTRIFLREIRYVESRGNDSVFHLSQDAEIRIRKGIGTVAELLPVRHFIRVHRSFIVAERLAYRRAQRNRIQLLGVEHPIPVGPMYQDDVDELFLK